MTIDRKTNIKREISAGIIVYRTTEEGVKFLVLYHGHNYWNFPKGKIESEEKSLEAALRETEEETGLTAKDLRLHEGFRAHERFYFRRQNQPIYKIVIFYLAETASTNVIMSDEHNGYGWFLCNEARRVLGRYRDSQRVLKQAYDFLKPRRSAVPKQHEHEKNNAHPVHRKGPRVYQPHPAWQGGNVRRYRPGNRQS